MGALQNAFDEQPNPRDIREFGFCNYFALFSNKSKPILYYILNFVVHQINNYSNYEQLKKCWNLSYELYLNIGIPQNLIYRSSGHLTHEALRNVLVAAINAYETPKQRQQVPKKSALANQ